ncbi:MAG: tRNA uridine-5-carboxymethylaminomethyl(34) synthesis GTPase MnmE [Puniceicoccales bacterium]|jgi:tRNA modification GTPase|nr:tRNA uridine-5-carboxymethylaminomethyl(34) synthesis GTPase MnmE [Puniceicoccales bacterium]
MADGTTFAALSTPPGMSGIAVLRLSGPGCRNIFSSALQLANPPIPRMATAATYRARNGETLDRVLVTFFFGPNSYTGDDLLEISCHGNPAIVEAILSDLLLRGCRMAEPGEFTRTAFRNGKLDLCQAEAVADLIHARGTAAIRIAQRHLAGELGKRLASAVEILRDMRARVEAELEFSDDGRESFLSPSEQLLALGKLLADLAATRRHRPAVDGTLRLVLLGAPNAGKSSLFNALLARDRAIVSQTAGTTRDFLEGELALGPWRVALVDTAGICEGDGLEQLAVEKTWEQAIAANLLLWVLDASSSNAVGPPQKLFKKNGIAIWNKCDLPFLANAAVEIPPHWPQLHLSTRRAADGAAAKSFLENFLHGRDFLPDGEELAVTLRQGQLLQDAANAVAAAAGLWTERTLDLAAEELRRALCALDSLLGRRENDAVLDQLFAKFCIGK